MRHRHRKTNFIMKIHLLSQLPHHKEFQNKYLRMKYWDYDNCIRNKTQGSNRILYLRLNSQLVPLQLQDINQEEKHQEPECLHNKGNVCTRAVDLFSP